MDASGVLITGVYGSGKSSTAEEIAAVLGRAGIPHGALDLDWLCWFEVDGMSNNAARDMLCVNLSAVAQNYVEAGVRRFVLALAVPDDETLFALRSSVPFPLRVARLELPSSAVRQRLGEAITAERSVDDLRDALRWLDEGIGVEGDAVFRSDRPITEVASDIVEWLGWTPSE